MARRSSLRDFQESLARRLANATAHDALRSRLVVESGGYLWLFNLPDAGEVMPVPWLTRVPMTQRWFNGLVNVRGTLYGVVDLADFCGLGVTPRGNDRMFLMCGNRLGLNTGLLVQRIAGLRNALDFEPAAGVPADKPWISAMLKDHDGRVFREVNVAALMRLPEFMEIAAEKSVLALASVAVTAAA